MSRRIQGLSIGVVGAVSALGQKQTSMQRGGPEVRVLANLHVWWPLSVRSWRCLLGAKSSPPAREPQRSERLDDVPINTDFAVAGDR